MSVVKCAPTTTLLRAITKPKNIKNNLRRGTSKIIISVTAKIVEEWPDGKEWKEASVEKKLKSKPLSISAWLGLGLPIICFNASDIGPTKIIINKKFVETNLVDLIKSQDLSKFIL